MSNIDINKSGWKVAWAIYPKKKFWKNAWRPFILTIGLLVCHFLSDKDSTEMMSLICSWIVGGFPSIIGFILTGYALIIGFSGSEFLLKLAKPVGDKYTTHFQITSSIFTVVIAVMVGTYIAGAVWQFVLACNLEWRFNDGLWLFNEIALATLAFCFFYAIFTLFDVVINIFNLGQIANVIAKNKLKQIETQKESGDHIGLCTLIKNILSL